MLKRMLIAASLVVASCGLMTVPRAIADRSLNKVVRVPTGARTAQLDMAPAIEAWKQQIGRALTYMAGVRRAEAAAAEAKAQAARTRRTQQTRIEAKRSQRSSSAHSGSYSSVAACVKAHESGNYSEHSHPSSGSGAYQFVPGTWRSYSAAAGHDGYAYAYQAPPSVQDAVFEYAIIHGGAHNWDPKFGNDPCTTHLP